MALIGSVAAATIAGPAGAGGLLDAPVTIEKDAVGAMPGTVFTIELSCTDAAIDPPGGGSSVASLEFMFTVGETGTAAPDGFNTVGFDNDTECTVTETDAATAATTSYACEDNGGSFEPPAQFCATFGPQAGPIGFIVETESQEVQITVTNTFDPPPPPPPPPVELQPAFTG
jgi:hypothetical protein